MANLSLSSLNVEITADATNALEAIQTVIVAMATLQAAGDSAAQAISSTKTQETGRNLVAGLANGMQDTSPVTAAAAGIGAAAVDAINSAVAAVDSSAVANVGASLAQGLTSGVSANSGSMSSALTSAVQSAASSAGSTASSNGQSIGKNLMSGIQSGIGSMVSSISSAAASAVRSAIAAAKAAASIKSPSQVMRDEVGVQLMRGMEVGVVNRVPATIQVIKESVGGVLSGAAQVINQGGIPAPALPIPAPAGLSIDYERMADAVAARPAYFHVGNKQLAVATRDEAARQQAVRVQQINAGYGGR